MAFIRVKGISSKLLSMANDKLVKEKQEINQPMANVKKNQDLSTPLSREGKKATTLIYDMASEKVTIEYKRILQDSSDNEVLEVGISQVQNLSSTTSLTTQITNYVNSNL